jgi:hypothetical protein
MLRRRLKVWDKSKTFRIYRIYHTQGQPQEMMVGRFLLDNNKFYCLEDHDGIFADYPEDTLDARHLKLFSSLMHSGYFKIVSENEANEGHHDNLIEELDIGGQEPDKEFYLTGQNMPPQRLCYYGNVALLDGQRLSDEELRNIVEQVNAGQMSLEPL